MVDSRAMIRAFMARLVERAGGVDAASALIAARLGGADCKGTISRRMSGQLEWPLVDIMALEDAVGDPCVRRWLFQSMPEVTAARSMMTAAAAVAQESGEAVAAALMLAAGQGSPVAAKREIAEAAQAMSDLLAAVARHGGAA